MEGIRPQNEALADLRNVLEGWYCEGLIPFQAALHMFDGVSSLYHKANLHIEYMRRFNEGEEWKNGVDPDE